jgi:signal transduction histidine kinase
VVPLGLTRYLGVPIYSSEGAAIGTLCFLDGHSDEPLGEVDVQFMQLLAMRVSAEFERERAIRERIAEQRAMVEQLSAANQRLQTAAEEKRRFVAGVIHDLRQPLAAMRMELHLLRTITDAGERAESLATLEERVSALTTMVEELMSYAEIESGRISWRIERIDLPPFLHRLLDGFETAARARGLTLRREIARDLGEAVTDPSKLTHILGNLLSNALKFTAQGGVTVRARRRERAWEIEVADSGSGIAAEALPHIFEEFYQAPRSDSRQPEAGDGEAPPVAGKRVAAIAARTLPQMPPGRGLGLAVVRSVSAAMGASIDVASEPGRGTCFRLRFPDPCIPAGEPAPGCEAGR